MLTSAYLPAISGFLALSSVIFAGYSWLAWFCFIPFFLSIRDQDHGFPVWFRALVFSITSMVPLAVGFIPLSAGLFFFFGLTSPIFLALAILLFDYLAPFYQSDRHPLKTLMVWSLGGGVFTWLVEQIPPYLAFHVGLSQFRFPNMVHLASYGGLHLVNVVLIFSNLCLYFIIFHGPWFFRPCKKSWWYGIAGLLLIVLVVTTAAIRPSLPGPSVAISLIQPHAEPLDFVYGWLEPHRLERLRARYNSSMQTVVLQCPELVIWPENGDGTLLLRNRLRLASLSRQLAACPTWALLSTVDWDGFHKRNTVFSLSPDGHVVDRYDKQRLTIMENKEFTSGNGKTFITGPKGLKIGVLICFESIFASLARSRYQEGADILLISASDTPFWGGFLRDLHAAYAPFRAAETGLPVIRAAVTGPSYWIDADGQILQTIPSETEGTVSFSLPLAKKSTWFMTWGRHLWLILSLSLAGAVLAKMWGGWRHHTILFLRRSQFAGSGIKIIVAGLGVIALSFCAGLGQWWPVRSHQDSLGQYLGFLKKSFFWKGMKPDGQERLKKISALNPPSPRLSVSLLALSVYGYEEPLKIPKGTVASADSWDPAFSLFNRLGFKTILERDVTVAELEKWPLPSLILLRVNDHLRPVTLLHRFPAQGAFVFDPEHPQGFFLLSEAELYQYFSGEGVRLIPPD